MNASEPERLAGEGRRKAGGVHPDSGAAAGDWDGGAHPCLSVFRDGPTSGGQACFEPCWIFFGVLRIVFQSNEKRRTIKTSRNMTSQCAIPAASIFQASLLHICAEFNHIECAKVLVNHGSDINAKAGIDAHGFGGQTPIFHTVNQNQNQSEEMLNFLLSKNADLDITVKGLIWGKSYEWATLIPSVNPISYAMMGLLPQMHRDEHIISSTVQKLMFHKYGVEYTPTNIPNKYLNS